MKDKTHHLKHLQKKIVQSAKKEKNVEKSSEREPTSLDYKRPKTIPNKRKIA